jgi:hypothetical protein
MHSNVLSGQQRKTIDRAFMPPLLAVASIAMVDDLVRYSV